MTAPYSLLERPETSDRLGCWAPHLGAFNLLIGYSAFGSLFLQDPDTRCFLVVYPLKAGSNAKKYGPFQSIQEFETEVLENPDFVATCLRPEDLELVVGRLGPLGAGEVFYPVPYPMLGGSGELDTYEKGDIWVFADLVGQSRGL